MRKSCVLLLSLFLIACLSAAAQQTLGSINGTVVDTSGAAIPGATVTVTDAEIGVNRTVKSQGNGFFQIFNLPIGVYTVSVAHDGFSNTSLPNIQVQEASATTVRANLKAGATTDTVTVSANPMLNATDTTNGYTLNADQIALAPLATGSFTQLATLSPGVNAELLSGVDTNAGLGNQPVWANGQRDTSNTFQVNGVDSTNIFNGKSSSNASSQRYQFNIGQNSAIGGETQTGASVYGSNGNSLPSPPPEFLQELRVNASLYDAQQGATSGAQIDASTRVGTNSYHGGMYGSIGTNFLNADPFFFEQAADLAADGYGTFPQLLKSPALHRWTAGGTAGGPILRNKLFFFVAYQHLYASDQSTSLSQLYVPPNLTNDRSVAGLTAALASWNGGTAPTGFTIDPTGTAQALLQATLPNGQYLIPSSQLPGVAYKTGAPNVTLIGTSQFVGDQATASLDYDVTKTDRLEFKYYYQNDPLTSPFGVGSSTEGFPANEYNAAQVGALDNTITIGPRLNWEQRLGYVRMATYSSYNQNIVNNSGTGPTFGIANPVPGAAQLLGGFSISEFANYASGTPSLGFGPTSTFANTGYYQNRLNPSTNVIYQLGKHTLTAGGGYSYTQLNIENNRNGIIQQSYTNFETFLEGQAHTSSVLESIDSSGQNLARRYYRTNEGAAYLDDKFQVMPNFTLIGGVRWDYHGGFTEKYGNFFNFDPNAYSVGGTDPGVGGSGFTVANDGLIVAGNNPIAPTAGASNSTLTGRQWGIAPRVGFNWSPKRDNGRFLIHGGFGIYYDRGELFTYLSPPAGGSVGGPFGVTQQSPLVASVSGVDPSGQKYLSINNPLGTAGVLTPTTTPPQPSINPAVQLTALQNQLNYMTGSSTIGGVSGVLNCGGSGNLEDKCLQTPLYIGAYDKNNVLPYTLNYTLGIEWQPRNDMAVRISYTGNRGRHSVIPIPFNEPQLATPGNPAMIKGANPHSSGESTSYGYDVLNGNTDCTGTDDDPCSIASEPWSTYDGGNSDFRVPYPGYSPYAALFETVGNSAYDALEMHLEKRMSHHIQLGASYTWSHALDEQSDIGLFFTGNDPLHLKNSYASADFDRTNVFTTNFLATLPNAAHPHSFLSYVTNDWQLSGVAVLQSGEPYSLYEFYGAVGSAQLGYYPSLVNPVLGIKTPTTPRAALTGNPGRYRLANGSYLPAIDPSQVAPQYLSPGQKGVPTAAQGGVTDPVDYYETDYATGNQRNIFRQSAQNRVDVSVHKEFAVSNKVHLLYRFNVFNLTNTVSQDVPKNGVQIGQKGSCATAFTSTYDCTHNYEKYGMIITNQADQASGATGTNAPPGGGSAGVALYQFPYQLGSGKSTVVPTTIPDVPTAPINGCVTTGGCSNTAASFGSVTTNIGSARIITMDLHVIF